MVLKFINFLLLATVFFASLVSSKATTHNLMSRDLPKMFCGITVTVSHICEKENGKWASRKYGRVNTITHVNGTEMDYMHPEEYKKNVRIDERFPNGDANQWIFKPTRFGSIMRIWWSNSGVLMFGLDNVDHPRIANSQSMAEWSWNENFRQTDVQKAWCKSTPWLTVPGNETTQYLECSERSSENIVSHYYL